MNIDYILSIKELRKEACKHSLYLFALYYFTHYFKMKSAPFHKGWAKLFMDNTIKGFINLGFRASAKTAWSKIKIIHLVCYKQSDLTLWISQDQKKGDRNVFDVANELQHNTKITNDFGFLFKPEGSSGRDVKQKTLSEFITENGVKVQSIGTTVSARGLNVGQSRPDHLFFDDIENSKTKKSATVTQNTIDFISEILSGKEGYARSFFNCNYISDFGVVKYLIDKANNNKDTWEISWINAEKNGVPTWPEKFTMTNKEANEYNENIYDEKKHKVSLESVKKELGNTVYAQEMMNIPESEGDRFFTTEKINERIKIVENMPQVPSIGYWKTWGDYSDDCVLGADVAGGGGGDNSVIQVIDLKTGKQIREYVNNYISPLLLGKLMVEEGKRAKNCLICPERNSLGIATIDSIKNEGYNNIYREKTIDKVSNRAVHKFGFDTNSKTRPLILMEFSRDFDDGLIEINSIDLLKEMRAFTYDGVTDKTEKLQGHFDRVMAFAIAWHLRKTNRIKGFIT